MLGYRTVLSTDLTPDAFTRMVSVVEEWVTQRKGFPGLPKSGPHVNADGSTLSRVTLDRPRFIAQRIELVEQWQPPAWAVESSLTAVMHVTVVAGEGRLWLWVDIEAPTLTVADRSGQTHREPQFADTPAVVSAVIAALPMRDGFVRVGTRCVDVSQDGVDELLDVLADNTRTGAVLVAAPPTDADPSEWRRRCDAIAWGLVGVGHGFVLDQAKNFNQRVPFEYAVPAGGIRTFLPGAQLSDVSDSFRHRLMHPATMATLDERKVSRIVRNAQIQRLRDARLPALLRDVDYEFLRERRMQPFSGRTDIDVSAVSATDELAQQVVDLQRRLHEAEALAEETLAESYRLQAERDDAQDEAEFASLEAEEHYLALSQAQRENEWLKNQLHSLQVKLAPLGEHVWQVPSDDYPTTFTEIMERIGDLDHAGDLAGVRFSGDCDVTRELDEHAVGDAAVLKTWETLMTFDAYARMRDRGEYDRSFSEYARDGRHGGWLRLLRIVWSEGQVVRTGKMSDLRRFPVDHRVDPSGWATMVAHVRIGQANGIAPRLYFLDTYQDVGYVTVGYIGRHLDNVNTN